MEHGVGGKLHSGVEWATCLCSSHGPTRKLTYVWASVKRNIVNTNVYKDESKALLRLFCEPERFGRQA